MANIGYKINLMSMKTFAKNAVVAMILLTLVPHQVVLAQTAPEPTVALDEFQMAPVTYTVQETLLSVCESRGYGEDCAKVLLGMLWTESSNISTAIGDHGAARGYFQIHYKLHHITTACAEDLVCSANWTLTYLESHSYPKYVSYAVQCHNSCNKNNGYAARSLRNGKRLWDQPLLVTQAAPINLAFK